MLSFSAAQANRNPNQGLDALKVQWKSDWVRMCALQDGVWLDASCICTQPSVVTHDEPSSDGVRPCVGWSLLEAHLVFASTCFPPDHSF